MKEITTLAELLTQPILNADSYKITHHTFEHPSFENSYGYIEARKGGEFTHIQFLGLQYFLRFYLTQRVTHAMIDEAEAELTAHGVPFHRSAWERVVDVHGGFIPVRVRALPEGVVVEQGMVLVTVESTDPELAGMAAYVETAILRAVHYPTTIATRSMRWWRLMNHYYNETGVAPASFAMVDFGARGAHSTESAALGGMAHLVNFEVTDNLMGIRFAKHAYPWDGMPGFSIPACYDEETEVLTESGFIPFRDVTFETEVAEYREDGSIGFVKPTAIVNDPYEGDMVQFFTDGSTARIDLLVTPNHRMIRRSVSTDQIEVQEAKDAVFSQRNNIPLAGRLNGDTELTDLERLRIAFQADGSFVSRPERYSGKRTGTLPIRFTLKKERKQKRLEAILERLGIPYTVHEPTGDREGYKQYWCPLPASWEMSKTFDWVSFADKSGKWADAFMEEISVWDGTLKGNCICYTSVDEFNADIVQAVASIAGMRASKSVYEDSREDRKDTFSIIASPKNTRVGTRIGKEIVHYSGRIYCISVPSKMVIVRRNGCVVVCGNTEHSVTTSWGADHEKDFFEHIIEVHGDKPGLGGVGRYPVSVVVDSYDQDNAIRMWMTPESEGGLLDKLKASNMRVVLRPDSGDPITNVVHILNLIGSLVGFEVNEKGYRVLPDFVRVIQGDGINEDSLRRLMATIAYHKWSLDNMVFGSGGGLLVHEAERDTHRFAMKTSEVIIGGITSAVRKVVKTDPTKASKAGRFAVVLPKFCDKLQLIAEEHLDEGEQNWLHVVYENGVLSNQQTWEDVRGMSQSFRNRFGGK